ncbi:spore germination protein [Bacillus cereus group sp. MYBK234-1]|uniref:spore germination protein n=1 Tax=unclassified Bacillus cereus group TaxID=2750818 RepID=UPI003F7AC604
MKAKSHKKKRTPPLQKEKENPPLSSTPQSNYKYIQQHLNGSKDLIKKTVDTPAGPLTILYVDTMIDQKVLQDKLLYPLLLLEEAMNMQQLQKRIQLDNRSLSNVTDAIKQLLQGSALVFFPKSKHCISFDVKQTSIRGITEPTTEKIIRGAHDGFIENIDVNVNIMRNRIVNPNLTISYFNIGKDSTSTVALLYLKDIANQQVIRTITTNIKKIEKSNIALSSSIEKYLETSSLSPFPQMLNTERPDRVMKYLLEGHVVLFEDNNPNALIMPVTFFSFYQSPEDDNSRTLVGLFFRLIRFMSIWISLLLPSLYIAIIGFHFELLPNDLIVTIKSSIQGIPYPPLIEALIMECILEFIREAAIRLPTPISQTIGVVGGLVIGDAVVKSGFVSNVMVVVIALTAIASFLVPSSEMSNSIRIVRFFFLFAASLLGLPGIMFALMIVGIHMCSLRSMGTPYLAPFALFAFKKGSHIFFPKRFRKRRKKQTVKKEGTQDES